VGVVLTMGRFVAYDNVPPGAGPYKSL